MSRGPGKIQRAIVAAINANPDKAWLVKDLCAAVYGLPVEDVEKRHTVSMIRALWKTTLPTGWDMYWTKIDLSWEMQKRLIVVNKYSARSLFEHYCENTPWGCSNGEDFAAMAEGNRVRDFGSDDDKRALAACRT